MEKISELSVFFPAYNEEANIVQTVNAAYTVCKQISSKFEIIVVNDGSKDQTKALINQLSKQYPEIKCVNHQKNLGYGAALKTGIQNSKYKYIAFNDGDGQFDFSEISKFIPYIDQYSMVIGYRIKRAEGFVRHLNAQLLNLFVQILFGLKVKDIDCAFKLFTKSLINNIPEIQSNGAIFSTELLVKTTQSGYAIKEIAVHHYSRKEGQATGANIKVIFKAIKELINLRLKI